MLTHPRRHPAKRNYQDVSVHYFVTYFGLPYLLLHSMSGVL